MFEIRTVEDAKRLLAWIVGETGIARTILTKRLDYGGTDALDRATKSGPSLHSLIEVARGFNLEIRITPEGGNNNEVDK